MYGNNAAPATTITSPTTRLFLEHAVFGAIFKQQNNERKYSVVAELSATKLM